MPFFRDIRSVFVIKHDAFRVQYGKRRSRNFLTALRERLLGEPAVDGFVPQAAQLYLLSLFDSAHNLPSVQEGNMSVDATHEIANALACFAIHPLGRQHGGLKFSYLVPFVVWR